jgi:hypothetical protein
MEYFKESKICNDFLAQYNESIYPELFPKLMKVAIYSLFKRYHKWEISLQEIDQFIHFFNYKNHNFEIEESINKSNNNIPPNESSIPVKKKLKKLNMRYTPLNNNLNEKNDTEDSKNCDGLGKFYPNDDIYINDSNNFFDENYYIPKSKTFRNIQLYNKRLSNPNFITQEKRIYPHWWWNIKDDIEQDDYSDNDSDVDHRPSKPGRFPKKIENNLKKKFKQQQQQNNSFSSNRPFSNKYYNEQEIFDNNEKNFNDDDNHDNNNNYIYNERESDYPSYDNNHDYPKQDSIINKGLNKSYQKNEINNDSFKNINNNLISIRTPPMDQNSKNINYKIPINTLGMNNPENLYVLNNNNNINNNDSTYNNVGSNNNTSSNFSSSNLKNQIKNKRLIKESTYLSYDKDFNLNGIIKKVKGKKKKGVKYSVSGNQLNEDQKGIRRRKK